MNYKHKQLADGKWVKLTLVDYFYFDNQFSSSENLWQNYFRAFTYATRLNK